MWQVLWTGAGVLDSNGILYEVIDSYEGGKLSGKSLTRSGAMELEP